MRPRDIPLEVPAEGAVPARTVNLRFSMAAARFIDPDRKMAADELLAGLRQPAKVQDLLCAALEGHRLKHSTRPEPYTDAEAEAVLEAVGYLPCREAISKAIMGWLNPTEKDPDVPNAGTPPTGGDGAGGPSAP